MRRFLFLDVEESPTIEKLISVGYLCGVREKILRSLEEWAKRKFAGNIWKAVEWAKEHGIDVNNVPRFQQIVSERAKTTIL